MKKSISTPNSNVDFPAAVPPARREASEGVKELESQDRFDYRSLAAVPPARREGSAFSDECTPRFCGYAAGATKVSETESTYVGAN
ncbi:MAG TPA: hypothetical protein VI756_05230, partial [Blastocatellia bacterium]